MIFSEFSGNSLVKEQLLELYNSTNSLGQSPPTRLNITSEIMICVFRTLIRKIRTNNLLFNIIYLIQTPILNILEDGRKLD